jgi:hypothetical protein
MNTKDASHKSEGTRALSRRSLLIAGASASAGAVAALGVMANPTPAFAENGAVAPEIEGTWIEMVTFPDLPPAFQNFPTLTTYARGGGLITLASNRPPAIGNLSFGTWAKSGPKQYSLLFLGMFFNASTGALENYIRVRETFRFKGDHDTYTGEATAQMLDLNMNVLGQFNATTRATRVKAQ